MTEYTKTDLDKEARGVAKRMKMETGKPAKLINWSLMINNLAGITLRVTVACYDGLRQRNVAI
uniref:Uncharacterized protein n=1 Tax=viral metagenome TaxID=1070528 RepID=A0A6M3K1U9_9ZZZZ